MNCDGEKIVIRTGTPVLYWSGNLTVARLGGCSDNVFLSVWDIGRRIRLEAADSEGGPLLASAHVSLESWTGRIGHGHDYGYGVQEISDSKWCSSVAEA